LTASDIELACEVAMCEQLKLDDIEIFSYFIRFRVVEKQIGRIRPALTTA